MKIKPGKYKVVKGILVPTKESINDKAMVFKTEREETLFSELKDFEGCIVWCFRMSPFEVFKKVERC